MPKLHRRERVYLQEAIEKACGGTPLQDHAEFAGGYLGNLVVSLMENWDVIRKELGLPSLTEKNKVVINACYGGFGLSQEAFEMYHALIEEPLPKDTYQPGDARYYWLEKLERDDPYLVQVVETLGEKANGSSADLRVETVDGPWSIKNHDGKERLHELSDRDDW